MLKEQLQADVKAALKAGDSQKRVTLSSLLSALKNRELEKRSKLSKSGTSADLEKESQITDEEAIEVISTEIKKRKESIETYTKASRPELAEGEQKELDILMQYMPEQLSDDAIRTEVKSIIEAVHPQGMKDMGKVIGGVMPKIKGKADGQTVSRIVKEELEKLA
jgi:uncharacterized protein YqeY